MLPPLLGDGLEVKAETTHDWPCLKCCILSKICNLVVDHLQGLHLIGGEGCVCVYECVCASGFVYARTCVCVSACLRPWEGWLCKPKLALAMPQSLSEMKDDGSTEPRKSKGGYSPLILMRTNTHAMPLKLKGCDIWYSSSDWHFSVARKLHLYLSIALRERERYEETKGEVGDLSWGTAISSHYWRRWPTVNRLESLRLNSWQLQVVYGAVCVCVCSL